MNNEQKLLDQLGELIIDKIYDHTVGWLQNIDLDVMKKSNQTKFLFIGTDEERKRNIINLLAQTSSSDMFAFFEFFEEESSNDGGKFKLIYEEDGKQYDLTKIGEGNLKAEPIIEGGWIDRFSKYGRPKENTSEEDK